MTQIDSNLKDLEGKNDKTLFPLDRSTSRILFLEYVNYRGA